MTEYFDMAKQICEKWQIPYIDLYTDEDFNNNQLQYKRTTNLPDLIHPNSKGFDIIAPVINDWMETIPTYYEDLNKPEEESSEVISEPVSEPVSDLVSEPAIDNEGDSNLIIYIICGAVVLVAIVIAVIFLIKKR